MPLQTSGGVSRVPSGRGRVGAGPRRASPPVNTRSQNVHLKNLSFLAKSKIGFFACFFAQT
jgi:hypothetical protein